MPKERGTLFGMLAGDEPGPLARLLHDLSGKGEGDWGEKCVETMLKNRVSGASFFRNVYVPLNDWTAELDVVMAARDRIYVFESKAYGGKIYGKADEKNWQQHIGCKQNAFYNPVWQNEHHIRHLAKALWISEERMASVVVFENRADLRGVSPKAGRNYIVCNRNRLPEALAAVRRRGGKAFPEEVYARICAKLREWQQDRPKEQHRQRVQAWVNQDGCPLCGKKLVERRGKYGVFIGCTGYPQCRYARKQP